MREHFQESPQKEARRVQLGVSHTPDLMFKALDVLGPLENTTRCNAEPRPASAEGTLPDVRGRRAGAYRHCVVCCCRFGMISTTSTEIR
jgi:hypothetical protein